MQKREFTLGAMVLVLGIMILVAVLSYYLGQKSVPVTVAPQNVEQGQQAGNTNNGNTPVVAGTPTTSGENIPTYQNKGKFIGYIKAIDPQNNGGTALTIDYVQWLPCSGNSTDCTNGYKVVNANPQLRFFPIAANASVTLQTYSHNTSDGNFNYNQPVSLATFVTAYNTPTPQYNASKLLYWITLSNGVVTNISEQYQP